MLLRVRYWVSADMLRFWRRYNHSRLFLQINCTYVRW